MAKVIPTLEQHLEQANAILRATAPPHPAVYAGISVWLRHGWLGGTTAENEIKELAAREDVRWREFKSTL